PGRSAGQPQAAVAGRDGALAHPGALLRPQLMASRGTTAEAAPAPYLRKRRRVALRLALPIIAGMLTQSLLNLVDAALVGSLGEAALAGVGLGGYAFFMITAVVFGLSSGVQAQTARRFGEGHRQDHAAALNAGLMIALAITLP